MRLVCVFKFMRFNLSTRKKEAGLTILSNLILQLITAICGFILPPLIIQTFGSDINGMVSSIGQFISYLNLVEAGVGSASIAALYKPLAEGNTEKRNSILSATSIFYNRSGLIFASLVAILAIIYPLIIGSQVDKMTSILMVLVLGITGTAEFFLIGKYRVLLTSSKKVYVISFVQALAVIINTIVAIVLIEFNANILIVKLASALIYLSRFVLLLLYVHKKYENINFKATPDFASIKQSKNALVLQVCNLIIFNSPVILITIFCSLKDASIYAVYAMVFTAISNLLGAFSNGMTSFLGEALVIDSKEHIQKLFAKYENYYFIIQGWIYSMSYILIMPFMNVYTVEMTDTNYIHPILALLFVITGFLNNSRNPGKQVIEAAGHFKKTQYRSVIEAAINIDASIVFSIIFGLEGVLLGTLCSSLYRTIDITLYIHRKILIKNPISSFMKQILIVLLYLGLEIFIRKLFNNECNTYFVWIVKAIRNGILLGIVPILFFLSTKILKNKKSKK